MRYYRGMKLSTEEAIAAMVIGDVTHDARRLMIAGLMNHDPETFYAGLERARSLIGKKTADEGALLLLSQLINQGDFSFEDPNTGEPSPLC
jgi:hypothetical protein